MNTIATKQKTLKWFIDRIGARVYRQDNGCDCRSCKALQYKGIVIKTPTHASYLNAQAHESGLEYFDSPQ